MPFGVDDSQSSIDISISFDKWFCPDRLGASLVQTGSARGESLTSLDDAICSSMSLACFASFSLGLSSIRQHPQWNES